MTTILQMVIMSKTKPSSFLFQVCLLFTERHCNFCMLHKLCDKLY